MERTAVHALLERPKYNLEEFATILGSTVYAAGGIVVVPKDSPVRFDVTVAVNEDKSVTITAIPMTSIP